MFKKKLYLSISICLIIATCLSIKSYAKTEESIIWKIKTADPLIALTFDDGPKDINTYKLLNLLDQLKIKATFFVVGKECEKKPDLILRMSQSGHDVENHSHSHNYTRLRNMTKLKEEINKTNQIIHNITGKVPNYYRPPGGKYTIDTVSMVEKLGMKTILWDINADDYEGNQLEFVIKAERKSKPLSFLNKNTPSIIENATSGSIILMHNGGVNLLDELPILVKKLRKKGFHFVTVSELIKHEKI